MPFLDGALAPLANAETIGHLLAVGSVSIYSFAGHRYLTSRRDIRFQVRRITELALSKNASE